MRDKVASEFRGDVFEAAEGIHADPYYAATLGSSYGSSGHSKGIARREELFQKTRQLAASLRRTSDAPVPGTGVAVGAGTASFVSLATTAHPALGGAAAAGVGVAKLIGSQGVHIVRNHYGGKADRKLASFSEASREAASDRARLAPVFVNKLGPQRARDLESAARDSDDADRNYTSALSKASESNSSREKFVTVHPVR